MADPPDAVNRIVGENLRRALDEAGSTLRLAAFHAGLSYRTVRRYAAGERDLPVPALLALLRAGNADLVRFAEHLDRDTVPVPVGDDEALRADRSEEAPVIDDDAAAQRELDHQLERLGVTRLAARALGPIDIDELKAVGDLVEQIVLELRDDRAHGSAATGDR